MSSTNHQLNSNLNQDTQDYIRATQGAVSFGKSQIPNSPQQQIHPTQFQQRVLSSSDQSDNESQRNNDEEDSQMLQEYLNVNVPQRLDVEPQTIPSPDRAVTRESHRSNVSSSSKQLLNRIQNIRNDLNQMAEQHNQVAVQPISPFRRHQSDQQFAFTGISSLVRIPSAQAEKNFSFDQSVQSSIGYQTQQPQKTINKGITAKMSEEFVNLQTRNQSRDDSLNYRVNQQSIAVSAALRNGEQIKRPNDFVNNNISIRQPSTEYNYSQKPPLNPDQKQTEMIPQIQIESRRLSANRVYVQNENQDLQNLQNQNKVQTFLVPQIITENFGVENNSPTQLNLQIQKSTTSAKHKNQRSISEERQSRLEQNRTQPNNSNDEELHKLDTYYRELIAKEREATTKVLVAKLNIQRMDLERKFSSKFQEAERKLKRAEALLQEFQQTKENLLKSQQKCRDLEVKLLKQSSKKDILQTEIASLKQTMEAERIQAEQLRQQANQRIDDMQSEFRRQHEQYIEVLQSKDDQITMEHIKTQEIQVQLVDRESIIRFMEQESVTKKQEVQSLVEKMETMVFKSEHIQLKEQLDLANNKIQLLQHDVSELHELVDKANFDKTRHKMSFDQIADKYLLIVKSLRSEMQGLKQQATGQIEDMRNELKYTLLSKLEKALQFQMRRDMVLQEELLNFKSSCTTQEDNLLNTIKNSTNMTTKNHSTREMQGKVIDVSRSATMKIKPSIKNLNGGNQLDKAINRSGSAKFSKEDLPKKQKLQTNSQTGADFEHGKTQKTNQKQEGRQKSSSNTIKDQKTYPLRQKQQTAASLNQQMMREIPRITLAQKSLSVTDSSLQQSSLRQQLQTELIPLKAQNLDMNFSQDSSDDIHIQSFD